jgi:hypothetical protein
MPLEIPSALREADEVMAAGPWRPPLPSSLSDWKEIGCKTA